MAVAELKIADDEMIDGGDRLPRQERQDASRRSGSPSPGSRRSRQPRPTSRAGPRRSRPTATPTAPSARGRARRRDTGGAAVALLRMGVKLDKKDAILAALRRPAAARRRLVARRRRLRPRVDLPRSCGPSSCSRRSPTSRRSAASSPRCRQSDGSYAVKPSGEADLGGTYYATTILRWVRLLEGEPALVETAGFTPLFNGKDLDGWEGDTSLWSARDGMLVGDSPGLKHNDFLADREGATATSSSSSPSGWSTARATAASSSGASASRATRCRATRPTSARTTGAASTTSRGATRSSSRRRPRRSKTLHKTGWNHYEVRAMGDRIRLSLNGVTVGRLQRDRPGDRPRRPDRRPDPRGRPDGGPVQGHLDPAAPHAHGRRRHDQPGFHLRTVKTDQGERKYTVYVPDGYDGKKAFPVVLFLHGSGERGDDGILGPGRPRARDLRPPRGLSR